MKKELTVSVFIVSMILAAGFARGASAVERLSLNAPPIVHLMIDTSGSMEYDVNPSIFEDEDGDAAAVPACTTTLDASGRSRYIKTTEILAGSLSGYWCESQDRSDKHTSYCRGNTPDCENVVPHIEAHGTRAADGLIDIAGSRVKFGIMTMDTNPNKTGGPKGDYSYGPEKRPDFGAQNDRSTMGKLVVPSASDDPADIAAVNAEVKASLLAARPHGATPIGAFLYDVEYMLESEETFTNDTAGECRKKHIVLFTDGRENLNSENWEDVNDGNNGNHYGWSHGQGNQMTEYPDRIAQAQRLRELGFEVWVVAFPVAAGLESDAYAIATNNGTLPDDHYFTADNIEGLATRLLETFEDYVCVTQSRTRTVYTNDTGNSLDVQYQFNSAFSDVRLTEEDEAAPGLAQGVLERSVYRCGVDMTCPSEAALYEIQNIGDKLNATSDGLRNIYTMIQGNLQEFVSTNNNISNNDLNAPNPAHEAVLDFSVDDDTGWCQLVPMTTGNNQQKLAQWRTNLFDYIRAAPDSCRDGYKLGAIYHSTPALQDDMGGVSLTIPSFNDYKNMIADRPFMLYVATHDGMMHAFRYDRPSGASQPDYWGGEMWAYIPQHNLETLRKLPEQGKETALDGTPVVADIVLSRTVTSRLTEDENAWKSVLLFGDRDGGRGFTALDVTDPTNGNWSVLWEVSANKGRCPGGFSGCNSGGSAAYKNNFSRLGWTYGRPAIGTVMICPSMSGGCSQGQLEEVAVAVFGGGSSTGLGGTDVGRTAYVVRLDNGEKIAEFASGDLDGDYSDVRSSCDSITNTIDADIIGDMTCISTSPGTFLTRCYVGDAAGRLWKMEIGSYARSEWTMSLFYDPYDFNGGTNDPTSPIRAPLFEAPAVSFTNGTNEPVIVFGTGDFDHVLNNTPKSCIVSLTDTLVSSEPAECLPWTDNDCWRSVDGGLLNGPKLNWKFFFGYDSTLTLLADEVEGARMMGAPIIYSGAAYFTTFSPHGSDPCIPGKGRLYGIDYVKNDGACDVPIAKLPKPDNPYEYDIWQEIGTDETGALPYGVVAITRPSCIGGQSIYDAGAGSATGAPFGSSGVNGTKLVVQTGLDTGEIGESPASGTTPRTIEQIVRTIAQTIQSILVGTWGAVFD